MLSDVYKTRLAVVVERMVEIQTASPKKYKADHEWRKLDRESKHLTQQINTYKTLLGNGINNKTA